MMHGRPAVIIGDITVACGQQCGFAWRVFSRQSRQPVDLTGAAATLTIRGQDKTLIGEWAGTVDSNSVGFYLTLEADQVPDIGEYVVDIVPNPFVQPRLAQGLVRFDKTAQEV